MKQILSILTAMTVAALFVAAARLPCLLQASGGQAQETKPPAKEDPKEGAALPDLKPIQNALEEIRGLKFKEDVPGERQSLEDFKKFVQTEIEKEYPKERLDNVQAGLLRLGMIKEKMDLGEQFVNAYLSQAAAYYNPESNRFYYLSADTDKATMETTAAHELVHALQDQHNDLGKMMETLAKEGDVEARNDDLVLAFRCLVEGEATYVQVIWQAKKMGMDITKNRNAEEMMLKMATGMDIDQIVAMGKAMAKQYPKDHPMRKSCEEMDKIPRYILVPLLDAYMKGAYFNMKARHNGDWAKVNDLWKDPPKSAEQCLHPEKYFEKRDVPTPIPAPDPPFLKEQGWTLIDAAIHGECYLNMLLREWGIPAGEAATAAAGWDGDIYRAYKDEKGHVLVTLATTWDTAGDAKEFAAAWKKVLDKRHKEMKTDDEKDGLLTYGVGGEGPNRGALLLRDREVFVVDGGSAELVEKLIDGLKAITIDHKE